MTISGKGGSYEQFRRVEAIEENPSDRHGGKKKKKVVYQGRSWKEEEEDLPVAPVLPPSEDNKANTLYADHFLLEKAEKLLEKYTTLEDKIAGLFFFEVEAFYDSEMQEKVQKLIQSWKVGGLIFVKGDYKRQLYLIEHYQNVASLFLLLGNDFSHGLSFYFQGELPDEVLQNPSQEKLAREKYMSDLGKAVVFQNRRLGVHIQIAQQGEELFSHVTMGKEHIQAFRKGIRDAHGIVGLRVSRENTISVSNKYIYPLFLGEHGISTSPEITVSGVYGLKKISFLDLTQIPPEQLSEVLLDAFNKNSHDAFLLPLNEQNYMDSILAAVRNGKMEEKTLIKKLLKILAMKSLFAEG